MSDLLTRLSFLGPVPVFCAAPTRLGSGLAGAAGAPEAAPYPAGGDPFPAQDPARVRAALGPPSRSPRSTSAAAIAPPSGAPRYPDRACLPGGGWAMSSV